MRDTFQPCAYLMANRAYGALYCGVTSDLLLRVQQHRQSSFDGFTKKHGINRLVWFEQHGTMEAGNPDWRDLAVDLGLAPLPPRPVHVERAGVGSPPSRG